jgi:hypothetical protein
MNIAAISEKLYTLDEYVEFEENSEIRHEFHEGILYPIEGTSLAHNEVIQNVVALLRPDFRKRGCKMAHENVKLQIIENVKYVYPDISIKRVFKRFMGALYSHQPKQSGLPNQDLGCATLMRQR